MKYGATARSARNKGTARDLGSEISSKIANYSLSLHVATFGKTPRGPRCAAGGPGDVWQIIAASAMCDVPLCTRCGPEATSNSTSENLNI